MSKYNRTVKLYPLALSDVLVAKPALRKTVLVAIDLRQWLFQFYGSDNQKMAHKGWAVSSPADSR